uniref:Pectinesterase inhibitor domain-containing protein n=1 Tax=Oryza punctata TaxID=4537 RepID=A0A0E0MDE7_ORYPU
MAPDRRCTEMLFFVIIIASSSAAAAGDIVEDTCGECSRSNPNVNYTLCVSSLSGYPGSRGANLHGLALISAMPLRSGLATIASEARVLRDRAPPGSPARSCLESCMEVFRDAAYNLGNAVTAIESWRYGDAKTAMSATTDAPVTCEDEFKGQGMATPPAIMAKTKPLFQQGVISLAIISLL